MLERAFLLRSCSDTVFESRTRPCLLHQIKRCSAPCTGEIGLEDYDALVEEATRFLRGESQNVRQMYQRLMQEAADRAGLRAGRQVPQPPVGAGHVTADQAINPEGIEEADVFAAYQEGGQTCVQVFFFRAGQNWGNRAYFPRADKSLGVEEVLESFIAQFYDDKPVPRLILLSHELPSRDLLAEALSHQGRAQGRDPRAAARRARPASSSMPCRTRARRWAASWPRAPRSARCWRACASASAWRARRARIEVFDNSHIMGTNAVGAMIVAGPEGFVKNQYRKFNIKCDRPHPRRRLRHDARGADAPLQAPGAGRGRGASRRQTLRI